LEDQENSRKIPKNYILPKRLRKPEGKGEMSQGAASRTGGAA
jgi:hypothetical protein